MDPISGFSIATSDGSSRLPLHVISLERRRAHSAIKYDCAGEPVGKPASSSIWCRSSIRFVAVRGLLPVSTPEWIPSRDSLWALLTDLFDFLFVLPHQEGASHILLTCLIVQVSQWESPLQVRFDCGSSSIRRRQWERCSECLTQSGSHLGIFYWHL